MRKKSKLPDNLYHFTSLIKYRIILESGKLALTPSNLKFDPDTFHYEPIYFREQEIGMQAVDKYKDHHPVVWLTANDQVTAQNTGLSDDKLMCRINIKTDGRFWRYLRWRDFCNKYHADRFATAALKRKLIRFQDSHLRMWRRSCLRKKNQIKTSSCIAPVYPISRYTGV